MFVFFPGYVAIYFHLTSPEFVGSISMETIQKDDNMKSTTLCAQPSLSALAGYNYHSLVQISFRGMERNFKCTQKQGLKNINQHCLPLQMLAAPKVNEHIRLQPRSNISNILHSHQQQRLLASILIAGMLWPIHVLLRLFKMGRKMGHLLLKSTLTFTIHIFTTTIVKKKPSAMQHIHTYTQSRKTSFIN